MSNEHRRLSNYSDKTFEEYREDFHSDDGDTKIKSSPKKSVSKSVRARLKGPGRFLTYGRGGRHSQATSDTQVDVVTKRLLSANRLRLNDVQNELEDTKHRMRAIMDENKLYKRMQHKQEKQLDKYEDRENELPQLIHSHDNEVRSLREQLRRFRDKYEKTDRYLRDAEDELESTKQKLRKYKNLSEEKELAERSYLEHRLQKAELALEEKDSKITELESHVDRLNKNHRHEIGIECARYRELQNQLNKTKTVSSTLLAHLKEKERQLEVNNIYANRALKTGSNNATPVLSPSPWRQSPKKKSDSNTDLTIRERSRAYEKKRKEDFMNKGLLGETNEPLRLDDDVETLSKKASGDTISIKYVSNLHSDNAQDDFGNPQDCSSYPKSRLQNLEPVVEKAADDTSIFPKTREILNIDIENRHKVYMERRSLDEIQHRDGRRPEQDNVDGQISVKSENTVSEHDGHLTVNNSQQADNRAKEIQKKLKSDEIFVEERRKKDELLRRLQLLDSNDNTHPLSSGGDFSISTYNTLECCDNPRMEPIVSPSRRVHRDSLTLTRTASNGSLSNSKKEYIFTQSVENLHMGKPSHDDVSVPYLDKQRKLKASLVYTEVDSYTPTFSLSSSKMAVPKSDKFIPRVFSINGNQSLAPHSTTPDKNARLMSELFGNSSTKPEFFCHERPLYVSSMHEKSQTTQANNDPKLSMNSKLHSSTKLNGFFQDEYEESARNTANGNINIASSSSLLKLRSHQPSRSLSKSTVCAMDFPDDDIEEVIL